MKRKVVKQGHNAMTITLPASWTKENNVKSGDELDVNLKGKDLIIKTDVSQDIEKTTYLMHGKGEYLHRHLGVLYRLGYDEIKIEFNNPYMVDKINYEIEQMPGLEIVDQGEDYCIIKNIAVGLEKEFDNILRKIFLNITYCGQQGLEVIKKGNFSKLESLQQLSRTSNRMTNFCQRLIRKEGYKDYKKTMVVYAMIWSLEQVWDYYNNIFKYLLSLKSKPKISNEILKIYGTTNELFEEYYKLFYSFDSNEVSDLKEKCINAIENIKKQIENKNKTEAIILLNLNLIVERLYHMTECLI